MTFARPIGAAAVALSLAACNAVLDFEEVDSGGDDAAAVDVAVDAPVDAPVDLPDEAPPTCVESGCPLPSLHCHKGSGQCVECIVDADCPTSFHPLHCDPDQHLCVECLGDGDCRFGLRCVLPAHRCSPPCDGPGQCGPPGSGVTCDLTKGICVECYDDTGCIGDPYGSHCEPISQQCVQCWSDLQCARYCDPASYRCVDCVRTNDCKDGSVCEPMKHTCVVP